MVSGERYDQFLCSICLDVFTDPVTTPCGHNFCKSCITQHWNINVLCRCPHCKEVFNTRPDMKVNTFVSEMTAQFRHSAQQGGRICLKHDKLLELFCKTDRTCICLLCTVVDHKAHNVVPLEEEYQAEIQQMILRRRLKIEEIRRLVELSQEDADKESTEGVQVFSTLKKSVERRQGELIDSIGEMQRKTEKQAEGFIKRLEQEICELKRRISQPEGRFLQSFLSAHATLPTRDWTGVNFQPTPHQGAVARAVKQLEDTLGEQRERLLELKKICRSAVDVTLDPETAHPQLNLSDDGRQVKHGDMWKNVPDSPKRFDMCVCVLAKQSFSSGRFYYEVWVRGKTEARAGPTVCLSLTSQPERVGVWVDYEGGLVSFYDVDAAALIYSFTGCCFVEKLYPYFSPSLKNGGKNSAPLIISPVNHTTI
uniref:Uncharacterized protein n=1 Tax=Mola mola TaxID=94237 RepID=A0A3Q3W8V0_MOLML